MLRWFDLMMFLYPAAWRAEYGAEMRTVLLEAAPAHRWREASGLLRGAIDQRCLQVKRTFPVPPAFAMLGGLALALGTHLVVYAALLPHGARILLRTWQNFAGFLTVLLAITGICLAQTSKEDPAALALAKSIYGPTLKAVRDAKTVDDLKRADGLLDSEDWISGDRFGRTVLTKKDENRELESMLNLPPEQRAVRMEIIWAEQDRDRLEVLMWVAPGEAESVDAAGAKHRITTGTLARDLFDKRSSGWMRIRHDKLTPNSTILAMDGVSRFMPPLDPAHRITAGEPAR
jgi:hypothetical protein